VSPARPATHQTGPAQRHVAEVSRKRQPVPGIIGEMTSNGLEHLARTAYEAHRGAHPGSLPPWEDAAEPDQHAWKAAVSAVAGQTGVTLADAEPVPVQSLMVMAGDQRQSFDRDFTAGRQGALAVGDDYASNSHARFQIAHGLWYVKDLGSTNGTWLNGRRIHAAQRLKKGDKIKIGHTVVTVVSA
jgi:pSer/pThr/pTyr-binding forkhead associated (FHA) protein